MDHHSGTVRHSPIIGEHSQILETHVKDTSKQIQTARIAGFPWQFVAVVVVIAMGVLGLVLKMMGLF